MDTIVALNSCGALDGVETVIDIGARNTDFAKRLLNFKIQKENITLTDITPLIDENPDQFHFIQENIADLDITKIYDLAICARVLPFTDKPLLHLEKVLSMGKIVFVSFFGKEDERKRLPLLDVSEIQEVFAKFPHKEILYQAELKYKGKLYNEKVIYWHEHRFILKDK